MVAAVRYQRRKSMNATLDRFFRVMLGDLADLLELSDVWVRKVISILFVSACLLTGFIVCRANLFLEPGNNAIFWIALLPLLGMFILVFRYDRVFIGVRLFPSPENVEKTMEKIFPGKGGLARLARLGPEAAAEFAALLRKLLRKLMTALAIVEFLIAMLYFWGLPSISIHPVLAKTIVILTIASLFFSIVRNKMGVKIAIFTIVALAAFSFLGGKNADERKTANDQKLVGDGIKTATDAIGKALGSVGNAAAAGTNAVSNAFTSTAAAASSPAVSRTSIVNAVNLRCGEEIREDLLGKGKIGQATLVIPAASSPDGNVPRPCKSEWIALPRGYYELFAYPSLPIVEVYHTGLSPMSGPGILADEGPGTMVATGDKPRLYRIVNYQPFQVLVPLVIKY